MTSQTTTKPYSGPRSKQLFETAKQLIPGGVNSPVRAFNSVEGTPLFIKKAQGAYIWDEDGKQYIDYVGSWGPAILGHAHPRVINRVKALADLGTSFGAPTELENQLAQVVIDAIPGIEMVRFVNSGTEAAMSGLRLARAYTGRSKVIKFRGCYHGHVDALLVKAGSGASTLGVPDSPGVPDGIVQNTLIADYNDLDSVQCLLEQYEDDIAGILVEPVAGNMGCVPPKPEFLAGLRDLTNKYNTLLVFDEVMTGFRVAFGGAQARYGVTPDITLLGKIVGGGLPVGAYGASKQIMQTVSPAGPMYQAGTLSGNPLAMGAGLETLLELKEHPEFYTQMEGNTQQLLTGVEALAKQYGLPLQTTQVGAMFSLFFNEKPVQTYDDVFSSNKQLFNQVFHLLLENGVYLAPSAFEAGFTSVMHTPDVIAETLKAFEAAFKSIS